MLRGVARDVNTQPYVNAIAQRLSAADRAETCPGLFVAALRELAKGDVLSPKELAKRLGLPAEQAMALLDITPGIEYDDQGRLIGYGLTRRETPHAFEVEGRRLYTWCALDALMFPALIGQTAQVRSRCPQTGESVTLTVTPTEVLALSPCGATMSLKLPGSIDDIRTAFCCHVHFFVSREAGEAWCSQRPGAAIVSVEDAFRLGQDIAHQLTTDI